MSQNNLLYLVLIILIISSCQKDEIPPTSEVVSETDFSFVDSLHKPTVLGKKLENPYSVENMNRAWKNLSKTNVVQQYSLDVEDEALILEPTHRYIKFMPASDDELAILESDSTLVLYDHPLDYEIEETGDYYRDPEIPEDQPTYQYASVPIEQEITVPVAYEILEELFIPDEADEESQDDDEAFMRLPEVMTQNASLVDALVDEALRITGNLEEDEQNDNKEETEFGLFSRRKKWRPAGRIQVWDDVLGKYIPMQGVKVRSRRWFTTHTGITNSSGYYSCDGRYRGKARYIIKWKRHHFSIRWSWLSTAKYRGPRSKSDWNLNIRGGTQQYYATIFRAAHHYYYENIKGLRRPPQNYSWHTQMKIRAFLENGGDCGGSTTSIGCHSTGWRFFGLWSPIKIYAYELSSSQIYATTIHELAHASHWDMDRSNFRGTNDKVKESWARGVEWELTRMKYPSSKYKGRERSTGNYTLVVADMIDNSSTDKTNFGYGFNNWEMQDNVSGYTIRQIEDALKHQKTWNGWRDNIRNRYENNTEQHLNSLFSAYE